MMAPTPTGDGAATSGSALILPLLCVHVPWRARRINRRARGRKTFSRAMAGAGDAPRERLPEISSHALLSDLSILRAMEQRFARVGASPCGIRPGEAMGMPIDEIVARACGYEPSSVYTMPRRFPELMKQRDECATRIERMRLGGMGSSGELLRAQADLSTIERNASNLGRQLDAQRAAAELELSATLAGILQWKADASPELLRAMQDGTTTLGGAIEGWAGEVRRRARRL